MTDTPGQRNSTVASLAEQAAARLLRTLKREEAWGDLHENGFAPTGVQTLSVATAWDLADGSQLIWFNNGEVRASPRQLNKAEIEEIHHRWRNGLDEAAAT